MKYEAIVFDLDGTVLDTIEDLCDAVNYAMNKYNLPEITIAQTKSYLGWGIKTLVNKSFNINEPIIVKSWNNSIDKETNKVINKVYNTL